MLEAPPSGTSSSNKASSSSPLFAFVPRQVTLAKHQNTMKKEELLSETPEVELTNKDKSKKKKKKKMKKNPSPLFLSIAYFLQHHGFTNTLAAFQAEASIDQIDDSKAHELDLEMFYKYLETSTSDTKSNKNAPEELGLPNASGIEEDQEKGKSTAETACTENTASGSQLHESEGKSKDKKRKKSKIAVENGVSATCTLEGKSVAEKSSTEIKVDEEIIKHKNKIKKNKSLDPASKQDRKEFDQVELCNIDSTKESNLALENTTDTMDKKSSKKRKRMVSEGNESQPDVNIKTNDLGKENVGTLEDETVSKDKKSSKKRKKMITEGNEFQLDGDEKKAVPLLLDDGVQKNEFVEEVKKTDKRSETPIKGAFLANGDVEKNDRAGTGSQKSMKKQQNGSSEPKTAFQRVKVDEVKFADDRLQDNSYWAKSGADIGYGAKAQEVLGQVRGRDFRHEKTKKKRGSYRGGQIDLQTHSVKFNYSDEE